MYLGIETNLYINLSLSKVGIIKHWKREQISIAFDT